MAKGDDKNTDDKGSGDDAKTTDNGDGGDKKPKDILVEPSDLLQFAGKIRQFMIPRIIDSKTYLDKIDPIAGNFDDAHKFRDIVTIRDGGRANQYSTHMTNLHRALENFADGLEKIARGYNNAEDMNKNIVQKLGEVSQSVTPYLPKAPTDGGG